eukprot:3788991-Pyramimonas_sp.AAC.1
MKRAFAMGAPSSFFDNCSTHLAVKMRARFSSPVGSRNSLTRLPTKSSGSSRFPPMNVSPPSSCMSRVDSLG